MEYWDLYNKDGELITHRHPSDKQIPVGLYHLVITLLIQHTDGNVLLTHRSLKKRIFPDKWEASISGRVQDGEDYLAGARRELKEELGLELSDILLVDSTVDDRFQIKIYNLYAQADITPEQIQLKEDEISEYKWSSVDKMIDLVKDETVIEYSERDFSKYPF